MGISRPSVPCLYLSGAAWISFSGSILEPAPSRSSGRSAFVLQGTSLPLRQRPLPLQQPRARRLDRESFVPSHRLSAQRPAAGLGAPKLHQTPRGRGCCPAVAAHDRTSRHAPRHLVESPSEVRALIGSSRWRIPSQRSTSATLYGIIVLAVDMKTQSRGFGGVSRKRLLTSSAMPRLLARSRGPLTARS
jgi:hypothetical protein